MDLKGLFAAFVWEQRLKPRPPALLANLGESLGNDAKNKIYFW